MMHSLVAVCAALAFVLLATPAAALGNKNMALCNGTRPTVPTDQWDKIDKSFFWFTVRISYDASYHPFQWLAGQGYSISSASLNPDVRGNDANFTIFTKWMKMSWAHKCEKKDLLCEMTGDACVSPYSTFYYPKRDNSVIPEGYKITHDNTYILATDYNTTTVLLVENVIDGLSGGIFTEIQVLVTAIEYEGYTFIPDPNPEVIAQALDGFCTGDMADIDSDLYYQLLQLECPRY